MDQIEEVRRKTDIVQLISEAVTLKKTGRNFRALCPFHEEKTPSFMVSPERQMFKCFGCFPAGELIKTKYGLKPIELVEKNDEVFTHKGKWKPVIRLLERDYRGDLISVKTRKLGQIVNLTGDHQIYVIATKNCKYKGRKTRLCQSRCDRFCPDKFFQNYKIEKKSARQIKIGDYLLYPLNQDVKNVDKLNLEKYLDKFPKRGKKPRTINYRVEINEDFLRLIGYWIAEGSSHRAYLRFSLGNNEKEFAEEIRQIIKRIFNLETGIFIRKITGKSGIEVSCCHSLLGNIFANLCGHGADQKHIPFELENLPKAKLKVLLEAIFKGDGHLNLKRFKKNRPGGKNIVIVSSILGFQLRELLLKLGFEPSDSVRPKYKDKRGVNHKKSFHLNWREDLQASYTSFWQEGETKYWLLPVRQIEKKQFSGKVYNLTVDQDHSYVANNFVVANCGIGGDVFKFVMERERLDFGEALRLLADRAGIELKDYRPGPDQQIKEKLLEINHLAAEFYHYLLTRHPLGKPALDYLLKRGISQTSIKTFKLGFSANEWESLRRFLTKKKNYRDEDVERAGLVIKGQSSYYDRFRGRVMFPLFDHRNRVVGFSGRVLEPDTKEAKYVNSPETLLYHKSEILYGLETTKEAIKKANKAVVVEGEFDLISSYQSGAVNVVAIKGSALTLEQTELLKRFCDHLVLSLDMDKAGDAASHRGIELAETKGLNVRVIRLSFGKDPDECVRHSAKMWQESIKAAVPIYDFYIDSAKQRFGIETPEGKRQISDELAPLLARITNQVIKDHYVKKLAGVLGVSEEAVSAEMDKKIAPPRQDYGGKTQKQLAPQTRQERQETYLLALVLALGGKMAAVFELINPADFSPGPIGQIFIKLKQWLAQHPEWEINRFVKTLPEELISAVDSAYLADLKQLGSDEEALKSEINKVITDLTKSAAKAKLTQLSEALKAAISQKDKAKQKTLENELVETSRLLGYNHD